MSRQAKIETDIVIKDICVLKDAVALACKELLGTAVEQIRYYAGKNLVTGIKVGHVEIGVTVENGKLVFVGEDYVLNSPEGTKIQRAVVKNYKSLGLVRVFKKLGYATSFKQGAKNIIMGVRS